MDKNKSEYYYVKDEPVILSVTKDFEKLYFVDSELTHSSKKRILLKGIGSAMVEHIRPAILAEVKKDMKINGWSKYNDAFYSKEGEHVTCFIPSEGGVPALHNALNEPMLVTPKNMALQKEATKYAQGLKIVRRNINQ